MKLRDNLNKLKKIRYNFFLLRTCIADRLLLNKMLLSDFVGLQ
jgi:hypothetical protein